jgi:hypothetical protein
MEQTDDMLVIGFACEVQSIKILWKKMWITIFVFWILIVKEAAVMASETRPSHLKKRRSTSFYSYHLLLSVIPDSAAKMENLCFR